MMRGVIIWIRIHTIAHFPADFCLDVKAERGLGCLRTVHNSYRDVLGAALAHPKEVQTHEKKEIDQV